MMLPRTTPPIGAVRRSGSTLFHLDTIEPFWAKITGPSINDAYPWTEQQPLSGGTWQDMPNGRSGTPTESPAYEVNRASVPNGTIVRLRAAFWNDSGVVQEYAFEHCCS